nr:HNH endonuclease [Planktothrix mougeotii]
MIRRNQHHDCGKNIYDNLQLLHKHCHDTKTANDGSLIKNHDNKPF